MVTRRTVIAGKPITPPPLPNPSPASPPLNTLPTGQTTNINLGLQFGSTSGNPISIADVDSPILTCVLESPNGYLEVVPNDGVTVSDNNTSRVTVTGSAAKINQALNGAWFVPWLNFSGTATISIRTSDGINIDTDTFNVTVAGAAPPPAPVGSPPQNNIPGPQQVQQGQNLAFTGSNTFSIADTDSTSLTTILRSTGGIVTVSTGGGATITGNGSATVQMVGTVGQINAALATAVYTANAGFSGSAQITIETSDGVLIDTDTVPINVTTGTAPPPSPIPSLPPFYPFGSRIDLTNGKYPFGNVVTNRTAAAMDADLKTKYTQWRAARVYNVPAISGAKAVKFTDANYPNTTNALTVSEGIGYGMILAAIFNDQSTFDGLLRLARARPAYSIPTNRNGAHLYLMDWKLGPNGESSASYGGGWAAPDGDLDIAFALCLAWRVWGTTGTQYNYSQEAKNTIGALKSWSYKADGTIWSSGRGDVSRLSDYMYGHFRAFKSITGDAFWDTALSRSKAITDKCQTVFSAANSGPGCFVPDAVVNVDGSRSGQTIPTNNVTNFGSAFGVSGTYGSGTNNYVPSPGNELDFVATEMHHYANSQRSPFRWAVDAIFSGDTGVREQCNRMNRFVPGFLSNNPGNCPIGFRLNAGLQGPQGGPIGMGNSWPARGVIQGIMNAAQTLEANGSGYQSWLNACYDWMMANWTTSYYDAELMLMGMVAASGNWFSYPGINVGQQTNPNAPVNTVPGPQVVATGATKTFNAANSNTISVTDANSANLTTVVSALHGTLKAVQSGGGGSLADGFPAKVVYGYWPGWGGQRLTSVSQNYNVICLFAARNAGNNVGDGSVTWEWGTGVNGWPTSTDIQEVRARGQKVILGVGGANHGYLYNTRAKSTALVNSLISIINGMGGVDGIDFNHYEGGITDASNQTVHATEMVWIAQQMKAQYGANFGIISPPQPNSAVDQYLMNQLHLNNVLTWCNPQYYDWSGFKAVGFISGLSGGQNRNRDWVNLLGQTKVAVGLSANYDFNSSLTLQEANREWDAVAATYPNERGVSAWNTELDAAGGNAFCNNFKTKFGSATSGGATGATVTNNDSTSVTIAGTIANVNAALNGLVYTPTAGYSGPDTITVNTSDGVLSDTDTIAVTVGSGTPSPPPPPPPPPPSGSTWMDVMDAKFNGASGDQGAWFDPIPVSRFQTFASGGSDLTAYGTGTGNAGLFGRWKDKSGRGHDLLETDQFSRPYAINGAFGAYALIYDRAPIVNGGGINGPFYICVVADISDAYYGTIISDRTGAFNGVQLAHNADEATAAGDIYASVGNGSARIAARCKSGAAAFTKLTGRHVFECWWEGPGNQLTVRIDKGTGTKLGTAALAAISAGGPDALIGADTTSGSDTLIGDYYQIILMRSQCPTSTERDMIATGAATRANLTV